MKRVLYLTNISVPYRVKILNEIAQKCDLTVLYERSESNNRNAEWSGSETPKYKVEYLKGIKLGNENVFSFGIIRHIIKKYDKIIVGCFNSPSQILAILFMRLFRISYILNLDGESFFTGQGFKSKLKRYVLKGADGYLAAGKTTADSIRSVFNNSAVVPYFFSSLDEKEIAEHARAETNRNRTVLVVGQYFDYKGLDVAVEVARKCSSIKYKFVGMGNRTDLFVTQQRINELSNVEVVPFLQKEDLEKEYRSCGMLLLPSRKECWGLVINEAASFGTPIVSTYGSGAAVEFLSDGFEQFLAEPNNPDDLYEKVQMLLTTENCEKYSAYLKHKSQLYSIDKSIESHCAILDI